MAEKARYWVGVLYPENMREDWETEIGDIIGLPYAYCIHNKDVDAEHDTRKTHVHLMVAYGNTTTAKSVHTLFNKLSEHGKVCCPAVQSVANVRNMYEYLIHNTETCKKKKKHLYDTKERITGNNFDIGNYEQLSTAEKEEMSNELFKVLREQSFINFMEFAIYVADNMDSNYLYVLKTNSSWFEKLTKGNYQIWERQQRAVCHTISENRGDNTTEQCCPECGSLLLVKDGKTQTGRARMRCKDCGKRFVV